MKTKKYKQPHDLVPASIAFSDISNTLAFGFGTGLSPIMPGTIGTMTGMILFYPIMEASIIWQVIIILAGFCFGIGICEKAGNDVLEHDHPSIVWDEIVAIMMVLAFMPNTIQGWMAAFLLFRWFDILKPWPIDYFDEKFKTGLGVMLDDLLAAIFAISTFFCINLVFN